MAKPVILGVRGFAEDFVNAAGCGLCIEPENETELVGAVLRLAEDRGLRERLGGAGFDYVKIEYDRERLAERYRQIIRGVVGPDRLSG